MKETSNEDIIARDNDFRKVAKRFIQTQDVFIIRMSSVRLTDIISNQPAPRFYISETAARRAIFRLRKGLTATPRDCGTDVRGKMYIDLFRIYSRLRQENDLRPLYARKSDSELIRDAMYHEAPCFYLPKSRAVELLCEMRK